MVNNIFILDKVFDSNSSNQNIFDSFFKEHIDCFIAGHNVSLFAYGHTSSGKTFTFSGDDNNPGIVPISLNYIFKKLNDKKDKFCVKVFYYLY